MLLRLYSEQANMDSDASSDADVKGTADYWHIKQWVIVDLQGQISQFVSNRTKRMDVIKPDPERNTSELTSHFRLLFFRKALKEPLKRPSGKEQPVFLPPKHESSITHFYQKPHHRTICLRPHRCIARNIYGGGMLWTHTGSSVLC